MKFKAKKSIIITVVTALMAVALGICAVVFSTKSNDHGDFNGTYRLTAFADGKASYSKINVFGREVDVSSTISIASNDGNYTLYLSVIDLGDLISTENSIIPDFNIGYKFGVGEYFTGNNQSGLSNVVYSSLTSGDSTLNVTDLGLDENMFSNPYFVIVELPSSTQLNGSANVILAEKHTLEAVEGQSATCSADGWNSYYKCTDEGCTKFFADSVGETEISDLEAWKLGDGKIEALPHTVVTDEAVAPNCTEEGLTQGSHCSVCGKTLVAQQTVNALGHTEVIDDAVSATCTKTGLTEGKHCSECGEILVAQQTVEALGHNYVNHICSRCGDLEKVADENGVYYQLTANSDASGYHFVVCGKTVDLTHDFYTKYAYNNEANTLVLENEIDGYPVTEIGEKALANYVLNENGEVVTGTTETSIKNIVVPENIETIGEMAFLDNFNIKSTVFLAQSVTLLGEAGDTKTVPFYGCTTSSTNNKTRITVYYHTIIGVENWGQVRRNGSTGYVIGKNGDGTLVSSGWDYARAKAVVNLNGVTDSTLTEEVANEILAKYYPVLTTTTFAIDETIEANLAVDFAKYDINENGINYKCVFTPKLDTDANNYTHVTYSVSYSVAKVIDVYSEVAFSYYGTTVKKGNITPVVVDLDDFNAGLLKPSADNYVFLGFASKNGEALEFGDGNDIANKNVTLYVIWGHSKVSTAFTASVNTSGSAPSAPVSDSIDGKWYDNSWNEVSSLTTDNLIVYTRTKFTMTVSLNRGGTDTNRVFIEKDSVQILGEKVSGNVVGGVTKVSTIDIYEGNVTFTITDKVLTITTDKVTYNIYVKEINWLGKDSNKRDIKFHGDSEVNADTKEIAGNVTLVLGY
ncbi:MAG: hypothetical protein ACI4MS_07095 [Candidatus Coproplasma sp.]